MEAKPETPSQAVHSEAIAERAERSQDMSAAAYQARQELHALMARLSDEDALALWQLIASWAQQAEARGSIDAGAARLLLHQVIDRMSDEEVRQICQLICSWVLASPALHEQERRP